MGPYSKRIVIVEPHLLLRTVMVQRLRQDRLLAVGAGTGAEALEMCTYHSPDLLISADSLEDSSPFQLAGQLHCHVIVLMAVAARTEYLVSLLDAGASEVLRKPFNLEEFTARCRTQLYPLRNSGLKERVCVGPLQVCILLRQVTFHDQPVELSPREFALLCALLMPPGEVCSRQYLLRMAWPPFAGGLRSVDTQVLTLRRKLEQAGLGKGGGITTIRQQGYRFGLENLPKLNTGNNQYHSCKKKIDQEKS
uniref:Two-component response regulator n=1 Tax=Paulinella chromatophora TaxID=39717 RepID=B1X5L7_PAUCH|nr:two-component response regulator [Paulinella chromatophora]ACB43236.1 two-component response regulator [Paulinella chromatophora]|eukprot:gb/GEZN01011054.1/.p1 GENE.gb/GEZN01011054.1/~~gb/GEZN01011054.1/.p1  ORF type:complete len:251 (+),score=-6.40 gb/GEZN01011054.1/:266-1018(+)